VKNSREKLEEQEMGKCEVILSLTTAVRRAQRKDVSGAGRDRASRKVCRPLI